MIHGGLGYLDLEGSQAQLSFPPELLEHSFVRLDGSMYGFYYQPPSLTGEYKNIRVMHDLMLTPIPYRFWPRSARLTLRIHNRPGTLHRISEFLIDKKASILQSESSRSGFRYATWSFYIVFEDLAGKLRYQPKRSVYKETYDRLVRLKADLKKELADELFVDRDDVDLREPVQELHNTALAYFHDYVERAKRQQLWIHEPFELECTGPGRLVSQDGSVAAILKTLTRADSRLAPDEEDEESTPTVFFAGLDTRYLNMRTAIISRQRLPHFLEIIVRYTRSGGPETCVGVVAWITGLFPPEYNILSSYIRTLESSAKVEVGQIVFVVEDMGGPYTDPEECAANARRHLRQRRFPGNRAMEFDFQIQSVTTGRVRRKTQHQSRARGTYDVFISHSSDDAQLAGKVAECLESEGLSCYIDRNEMEAGDTLDQVILRAINDSKEIWVLCTPKSLQSEWVLTEWGAGWALGKRIVPVLHELMPEQLPSRLAKHASVKYPDLKDFAQRTKMRIDGSQMG